MATSAPTAPRAACHLSRRQSTSAQPGPSDPICNHRTIGAERRAATAPEHLGAGARQWKRRRGEAAALRQLDDRHGVPCTHPVGFLVQRSAVLPARGPRTHQPAPSGKTGRWYVCHRLDSRSCGRRRGSISGSTSRRRSTQGNLRSTSLPSYGLRRSGSVSRRRKARPGFLAFRPTSGSTTLVREHSARSVTPPPRETSPSR